MPGQSLSRPRRQLPFQESLYDAPLPPLKGEVPVKQAAGRSAAQNSGSPIYASRIRR